ncbi:MAG: ROK family transcriptional regulator [Phycisphaerales bacterium]|jgi:predicted NBD/HSP70 family sugar kinase|nr:ROK family transcriptional regulator [Phycisphaerales bacterium]
MLVSFETIFSGHAVSALDRDKAKVFQAVCGDGPATRKRLAKHMGMRPTTVSRLVNELIDDGLIEETRPVDPTRQGRPEILLEPKTNRFLVLMIHVVSHDIRCALVDMEGAVIREQVAKFERTEADNDKIAAAVTARVNRLTEEIPDGSTVLGIGVAVPGIIDPERRRWIYSARWPRMSAFSFDALTERTGLPIRVDRNLNLELRTRLMRRTEERKGGVLFIHWGYGIGSAYAWNGTVIESSVGSFGEFGHWTVDSLSDQRCHCGEIGCLETVASLWSLLPEIRNVFPEAPTDEFAFEAFLRDKKLAALPAVEKAVDTFALALANLNKAFYAERIVLTGPFVAESKILEQLERVFRSRLPEYARDKCRMYVAQRGATDVIQGCSMPFFEDKMRNVFRSHR